MLKRRAIEAQPRLKCLVQLQPLPLSLLLQNQDSPNLLDLPSEEETLRKFDLRLFRPLKDS